MLNDEEPIYERVRSVEQGGKNFKNFKSYGYEIAVGTYLPSNFRAELTYSKYNSKDLTDMVNR